MKTGVWRSVGIMVAMVVGLVVGGVAAQEVDKSRLPGRIAYIGDDYNVYALHFANQQTSQLTTDGSNRVRYQWPTWAYDGRLAYFCCDLQVARELVTSAHISPDGTQPGRSVYNGFATPIIYAAWAPRTCASGGGCLDLAMLVNDIAQGNLRIDLIRDTNDTETFTTIAEGSPFYYSWSPDGRQMAFHRNNRTLDIYDVITGEITQTADFNAPGTFQAPAWSPVDDRVLAGRRVAGGTSVVINTDNQSQTLLPELSGNVAFSWSPDGNYVAYRVRNELEYGALFVVDAISGEVVSRSSTSGVIAFFWSPDSRKLAYVSFAEVGSLNANAQAGVFVSSRPDLAQNVTGLAWSTLEIESGLNRRHSAFLPTGDMVYLLFYFDQFAQSHRVWSPDSHYIVYTELTRIGGDERPIVSVLNVAQANSVPLTVADGYFAVWSFD